MSGSALNSFLKPTTSLWPFGRVPYRIDTEEWGGVVEPVFWDDQIENITQALQKIETGVPCIDFREVDQSYRGPHLIFTSKGDGQNPAHLCYSQVGRIDKGNGQIVNLGSPGCLAVGQIIHETLHALGATHEMMRADRDLFVKILLQNIKDGSERNFLKKETDLYSTRDTPFDFDSIMIYGPTDYGILDSVGQRMTTIQPLVPGEEIRGPGSKTDLSLVDKIELARTYSEVTDDNCFNLESVVLYAAHVDSLRKTCPVQQSAGAQEMLVRKEVGNPADYFDKTFAEYQKGFSANGESWLGLDNLHRLTSQQDYKLKITMTDFDGKKYVAIYDQFKVGPAADGYRLTVGGFNDALSTLGDSITPRGWNLNGMKFTTKDRDQDRKTNGNCAQKFTGGWWYYRCGYVHLTGMHTPARSQISGKNIYYHLGGKRGNSYDSWAEAEMLLLPN